MTFVKCYTKKEIKGEIKVISSSDSILRDCIKPVKNFSWVAVLFELVNKMPTLRFL